MAKKKEKFLMKDLRQLIKGAGPPGRTRCAIIRVELTDGDGFGHTATVNHGMMVEWDAEEKCQVLVLSAEVE